MQGEARKLVSLFTPLLLHQTVMLAAALLLKTCADQSGLPYDAALSVLAGNLLVIPFAAEMYKRDRKRVWAEAGEKGALSGTELSAGRGKKRLVLSGLLCFLGGGALNAAWSGVLSLLRVQEIFSNQVQEQLLSSGWPVQILGLGLAAPIAEELIFRGLTYRRMRRFFSVRIAAVLSALLFAVYHGNIVQILFAFPLSVVLALVYEHGKLFVFPVLFHMGSNLTAILMQILFS